MSDTLTRAELERLREILDAHKGCREFCDPSERAVRVGNWSEAATYGDLCLALKCIRPATLRALLAAAEALQELREKWAAFEDAKRRWREDGHDIDADNDRWETGKEWDEAFDRILGTTPAPDAHATDATCDDDELVGKDVFGEPIWRRDERPHCPVCHRTPCGHWSAFVRDHLATDAQFVNMDEIEPDGCMTDTTELDTEE